MKKKLVVAGVTAMLGLTWGVGGASAHEAPVGQDPNDPSCYGQRVSHGSSAEAAGGHGTTPKERTEMLSAFHGRDVSVREWHRYVKQCPPAGSRFE